MNVVLRNSHVDRIVHPHDWPHAECVRALWPGHGFNVGITRRTIWFHDGAPLVMCAHVTRCVRCEKPHSFQQWRVWTPEGYEPRPCDIGPCPACDKWSAPSVVQQRNDGAPAWDSALLRIGETVAWHELADRELMEIIRFEGARLSSCSTWFFGPVFRNAFQRDLGFAVAEATYRNLLPTQDDLRVGFDLAWQSYGDAAVRFSFADLWCLAYDSSHST